MGRLAFIFVLMFGLTLGIMTRTVTRRLSEAVSSSSSYSNKTQAKNIASSAAEIYLWRLKAGTAHDPYDSTLSMLGGSARVTITNIDIDAAFPETLQLRSIGTYGKVDTVVGLFKDVTDTISVTVFSNAVINSPVITGAMAVSGGSQATIASSGKDSLDGHNYNLAGTAHDSSCSDMNGLTYSSPAPTITHSGTWSIIGSGATPDTQAIPTQPNYDALALQLEAAADSVITWNVSGGGVHQYGDTTNPLITVFKAPGGKASGTVAGAGVLIMDLRGATADMQFSGTLTWIGLCIVIGDPAGHKVKWSNALPITGALLLTGTTPKWETSNNLKIHYSCEAIALALGILPANAPGNWIVGRWWE